MTEHIAIVDDDARLREQLAAYLRREGFRVTAVDSAAAMREMVRRAQVDLAIVDLTMPGEDGLSLTRFLRDDLEIGIIILTGMSHPDDRAVGLEVGADDYVAKPFHLRELLARVKSVLRRTKTRPAAAAAPPVEAAVARFAGWRLDLTERTLISPRGHAVHLTAAEFQVLSLFVDHPKEVLGRDRLLGSIAARKWDPYNRTVDQHVSRLRRKIEPDPKRPQLIRSVRGQGYVFTAPIVRGN